MIERIIDAEYTAEKQEGTVPPCENSVVTVTGTYTYEFTLEDGDSLSDIDTANLTEGSIAIDGDTTYEWDGTQWVASGGGVTPTGTIEIIANGMVDVTQYATANVNVPEELTHRTVTIQNSSTVSFLYNQLYMKNGFVYVRWVALANNATKDAKMPIPASNNNFHNISEITKVPQDLIVKTSATITLAIGGNDSSHCSVIGTYSDGMYNYHIIRIDNSAPIDMSITLLKQS